MTPGSTTVAESVATTTLITTVQKHDLSTGPAIEPATAGELPDTAKKRSFSFTFWAANGWMIALIALGAFVSKLPLVKRNDPDFLLGAAVQEGEWTSTFAWKHPLGVDENGNDLLTYALHGARVSLIVGVGVVTIGVLLGGWLGMVAGYFRGRLDSILTFATNALLSIPPLLFLLMLVAVLAANSGDVPLWKFILTLGVLFVPIFFRVVRAATLQQASREYVLAARSLGAKRTRILLREILPNVLKPTVSYALVSVGSVIVIEGSLSFLGAGLSGNTISWGRMIQGSAGLLKLKSGPHATFVPAGFIFVTVLALNFIGDKVRERLEVKQGAI
jgi:peptide/nickel transport system permease protein